MVQIVNSVVRWDSQILKVATPSLNSILRTVERHWRVLSREYHDLTSFLLVFILLQRPFLRVASMSA